MLKKIFSSIKTYDYRDLLNELLELTFIEHKVNEIYSSIKSFNINWQNENGEGFLHLCAAKNLTQSMQWLIDKNCDINLMNKDGLTPIFYAIEHNKKKLHSF